VNGGEAVRLTQRQHRVFDLDWTPDGRAVVLATQEGLWKLRIAVNDSRALCYRSRELLIDGKTRR
jgi:hypothetical protein